MKVEGLSKAALIKSLSPRVMLSNHLLPKGTKMKVNLEDQGRQKVSFSFAQTKRPLQNPFFISTEKSVAEAHPPSLQTNADKGGTNVDHKAEQKLTPVVLLPAAETHGHQVVTSQATKLKTDLTKMHFKKQILCVSVTEDKQTSVVPEEPSSSSPQDLQDSTSMSVPEFPTPPPQSAVKVCPSENVHAEAPLTRVSPSLKKPEASSGKDGDSSSSAEQDSNEPKRTTRSQSKSAAPGSESDGDSVQMSYKSADSKRKMSSDSRSKELKKSSFGSHLEEKEKSSSKRSENHERSSSYSKSDRESRHISSRSSRSDRDHRRTRSRSRSRSRGSRTSSSHSRSERTRGDRGSRSERSYYHDSDRRTHRSSPRRDRRRSRSRTDRTRDSSDSEDDHRKTRTRTSDSSRSSTHSSSLKDSKSSSHSKPEKTYKSADSLYPSESDKRTQSSKCERTSKRLSDSDSQRSSERKSSSYHKSDSNKSSSSSMHSHPQTYEKRPKSSSSDSDTDHREKSQASDKSSGSEENSKNSYKKTSSSDPKQMTLSKSSVKSSEHERQSDDVFHSPDKELTCPNATESYSVKMEISDSEQGGDEHGNHPAAEEMVSSTDKSSEDFSFNKKEINSGLQVENENAAITSSESVMQVKHAPESLDKVKDSLSSDNLTLVNSGGVDSNSCSSSDSSVLSVEKTDDVISCGPTLIPIAQDAQQDCKLECAALNKVSNVDRDHSTNVPVKSDPSCPESENQLSLKKPNLETVRKSYGATKKSRWDIVGQDTSDSDNSQRTLCAESKPTVKKVISVKKIEFSKDINQQDSSVKEPVQEDTETHSRQVMQTGMLKQEVGSERMLLTDRSSDQSEPSQESATIEHSDSKIANKATPLYLDDEKLQRWTSDDPEDKESVHKTKLNKRSAPNQGVDGGQSDASDSDNSEYDSDCSEAIKRLHSVVVVPKNSSLTLDAQDAGSLNNRSELQNTNTAAAAVNISQILKPRQENLPAECVETSAQASALSINSMLCQSQSNMIDSTSHSEGSASISAQPCMASHISAHESTTDATYGRAVSRPSEQGHTQHVNSRSEMLYSHYQPAHFSNSDKISEKKGFGQSWDFSQSEQPSSTYQQPDSSHGPQLPSAKVTEISLKQQELMQMSASWNHQSVNMQTGRKIYHHEQYQDPASEIHPDSLTSDHDDYSADKSSHSKTAADCTGPSTSGSSGFVQGHEISSNSRGTAVPDPPREDSFRPHRGRGPPKKRRPEVESDSDNEAAPSYPADKKERRGDDVSKESHVKSEIHRPSLTLQDFLDASKWKEFSKSKKMPPYFDLIEENVYLTER